MACADLIVKIDVLFSHTLSINVGICTHGSILPKEMQALPYIIIIKHLDC